MVDTSTYRNKYIPPITSHPNLVEELANTQPSSVKESTNEEEKHKTEKKDREQREECHTTDNSSLVHRGRAKPLIAPV